MNEEAILDEAVYEARRRVRVERILAVMPPGSLGYCNASETIGDMTRRIRQKLGELAEAWNRGERVVEGAREGGIE